MPVGPMRLPIPAGAGVNAATLVAPGAMTHSLDMGQRVAFLQVGYGMCGLWGPMGPAVITSSFR